MHCDCQATISIAKNKSFNNKNQHFQLKHDVVKQLLKDGITSIDYVKSEMNLVDPLTKPLCRKMILETSRGKWTNAYMTNRNDGNPTYMIRDLIN
jgi:hypothetical protein